MICNICKIQMKVFVWNRFIVMCRNFVFFSKCGLTVGKQNYQLDKNYAAKIIYLWKLKLFKLIYKTGSSYGFAVMDNFLHKGVYIKFYVD